MPKDFLYKPKSVLFRFTQAPTLYFQPNIFDHLILSSCTQVFLTIPGSRNFQRHSMVSSGVRMGLVLVLVIVGMLYSGAMAQSGCSNAITSLASCLNYVTGNSTTPSSTCCSQLANVVQSSPQCLCSLLNNSGSSQGITINRTLALSLPGACKVQTPPISQCEGN